MYKFSILILFYLSIIDIHPSIPSEVHSTPEKCIDSKNLNNELSILTLNTWGLPVRLAGHDQQNRFNKIPLQLKSLDADIICLQECFSKNLRKKLVRDFIPNYNCHTNLDCDRSWNGILNMDCQGGLLTATIYPIIHEEFVSFEKVKGMGFIEKIGAKGFLITTINVGQDTLNVINTHLYSGNNHHAEAHRVLQIQKIEKHLQSYLIHYPHNTILIGDLNITHPDITNINDQVEISAAYSYLESEMCFIDSRLELTENDYTMDPNQNPYSSSKDGGQQKLDYCMLLDCRPKKRFTFIESDVVFTGENAISDHMGLLSIVDIGNYNDEVVDMYLEE